LTDSANDPELGRRRNQTSGYRQCNDIATDPNVMLVSERVLDHWRRQASNRGECRRCQTRKTARFLASQLDSSFDQGRSALDQARRFWYPTRHPVTRATGSPGSAAGSTGAFLERDWPSCTARTCLCRTSPPQKDERASSCLLLTLESLGRGGGIRTRDPLHPMQVRYQAALRPD
jgi:hypothetical protein